MPYPFVVGPPLTNCLWIDAGQGFPFERRSEAHPSPVPFVWTQSREPESIRLHEGSQLAVIPDYKLNKTRRPLGSN